MNWLSEVAMPASRISNRPTLVIGHRGAPSLAPENTLAGFEAALACGVDGVEFDVQRTTDGHLMLFHDGSMERLTHGHGDFAEKSLHDLGFLTVDGEAIPSLPELFDFMRGNDLLLFLELKDPFRYDGIESEVVNLIRDYNFVERVQVRSFFHPALHRVAELAPEISISELWFDRIPTEDETGFKTVNCLFALYDAENIAMLHQRGQKATAWTVNDMDAAQQLVDWGIDGIATDYPQKVVELITNGTG